MNNKIKLVYKALFNPRLAKILFYNMFSFLMSDRRFLEKVYPLYTGEVLNLNDPRTFGEKIQWLKLYDRNPNYPKMVDKYEAKQYVADLIGNKYVIPTLGVWDNPEDIDFNSLPNRFVLKTTHDGGSVGVILCKDKSTLDIKATIKQLRKCLKRSHARLGKEWVYDCIPRRVIAEQYLEQDDCQEILDYKFFCFDGIVKFFKIDFDRFTSHRANYYDKNCKLLPFGERVCPPDYTRQLIIPDSIEEMMIIAEKLSKNHPFLRVDMYCVNGRIYFGELTFFPASGFGHFIPEGWDTKIGEMIKLPIINEKKIIDS